MLVGAATYSSNFMLMSRNYFSLDPKSNPLRHFWSLAVEEQFYIFFPPILLLIWKRKWPLAAMLGVLLIASMIGNLVMSYQNGVSDFFLTPYRAWEFLGGSLLAWWHYDRGYEEDVPHYREALSLGGVLLLALGMGLLHKGDPYPGWRALLPVATPVAIPEAREVAVLMGDCVPLVLSVKCGVAVEVGGWGEAATARTSKGVRSPRG
jgi:peptidoglycan/LPS O-acetylase OafA/YrhL